MDMETMKQQLVRHEGLRLKPYKCPAGFLTIGIGRNLEKKGITKNEAFTLLEHDINECIKDLRFFLPIFNKLSDTRQMALVNMRFNLGCNGFRKFKRMIDAVNRQDFSVAANEMVNSIWYYQVGARAKELVNLMKEG